MANSLNPADQDSRAREILRSAVDNSATERPPPTLYHYTSFKGAFEIVRTGVILASHIRYLNDRLEFDYCWNVLKHSAASWFPDSSAEVDELWRQAARVKNLDVVGGAHVFSLSAESDLLSQWRGYADDGHGVALGFSTQEPLHASVREEWPLPFIKARYSADEHKALLAPYTQAIIDEFGRANYQGAMRDALDTLVSLAGILGPQVKNPAFAEEREWRIVHAWGGPHPPLPGTKVRHGARGLVPYCEFRAGSSGEATLPISEVVLGPKVDPLQGEALLLHMHTHGYEAAEAGRLARPDAQDMRVVRIRRSSASYR